MDDLKALYFRIENPIDNKNKWNKLLNIYSASSNFNDFYSKITEKEVDNRICYDEDDKKNFYLIMWSIWKQKLLSLSETELRSYIDDKEFESNIYEVVKTVRELDSIKSFIALRNVLADPDINRYFSGLYDEFNHDIIICSEFGMRRDPSYNTVFVITVGAVNLYRLLKNFVNECNNIQLPYYIKYKEEGENIEISIYSSVENIKKVESLLAILKKENYTFFKKNKNSHLLSGNVDDWISIRNKDYYNPYDYMMNRSSIFFRSIDGVIYEYILNHLNILVSYKGGRMNLIEYLSVYVMERIVNKLLHSNIKNSTEYFFIANSRDLLDLKEYIKNKLSLSMRDILSERIYLKPDKSVIPLQLNPNKTIEVESDIFMSAIRNLVSPLILKDNSLEKAFRVRIKNECNFYKADPDKFCLDASLTKKLFFNSKQYDSYKDKIDKIHSEVEKFDNLENLINSEINQEVRDKISVSMVELLSIFED